MDLRSVDKAGIEIKMALACVLIAGFGTSSLTAGEIADAIKQARITGGIVVVVSGSDASYDDAADSNCTVHGLESDSGRIRALRRRLQEDGRYGRVSVSRLAGEALPYIDNLINLAAIEGGGTDEDAEQIVTEDIARYPEQYFFGTQPSCGVYIRHARNIEFVDDDLTKTAQVN